MRVGGAVVEVVAEARLERRVLLHLAGGGPRAAAQLDGPLARQAVVEHHLVGRGEGLLGARHTGQVLVALGRRLQPGRQVARLEGVGVGAGGEGLAILVAPVPEVLGQRQAARVVDRGRALRLVDRELGPGRAHAQAPEDQAEAPGGGSALVREHREEPHAAQLARVLGRELVGVGADEGDELRLAVVELGPGAGRGEARTSQQQEPGHEGQPEGSGHGESLLAADDLTRRAGAPATWCMDSWDWCHGLWRNRDPECTRILRPAGGTRVTGA